MGVGATPCVSKLSVLAIREKKPSKLLYISLGGPEPPISNHLNLNQKLDLNLI